MFNESLNSSLVQFYGGEKNVLKHKTLKKVAEYYYSKINPYLKVVFLVFHIHSLLPCR
jgi:hypothetical protein